MFFISGPQTLVSGALAQDIAREHELKHNVNAMGTIAGFVDGSGSFCSAAS